jgi:murein DD-endopeptidase MepM/ murein hydrolase activator NlpD
MNLNLNKILKIEIKMNSKQLITGLFLWLFLIPFHSMAGESCSLDVICIRTMDGEEGAEFYFENYQAFDVTLTLDIFESKNVDIPVEMPYTETFEGYSEIKLFDISIVDEEESWKYQYNYHWTRGNKYAKHDNSYVYALPYEKGKSYTVLQSYNGDFSHYGDDQYSLDFTMPEGTPIHAAREGIVVGMKDSYDKGGGSEDFKDYSNYVIIQHSDKTLGEYHHLKKQGVVVDVGDSVDKGQLIGFSGNTGFSTQPHLHFGVYKSLTGNKRKSFSTQFNTQEGIVKKLLKGESYTAE